MGSESKSPKGWAMSFWEHIDEAISRLKVVLVTLVITIGIGWIPSNLAGFKNPIGPYQPLIAVIMVRLKDEFLPKQATLIAGGLADTVYAMAYLSVIIGFLLASPVIFYEIIAFVKPALYENEKRVLGYYLGGFLGLLTLGVAMAYFLIIPIIFKLLIYFSIQAGATPLILISDFYNWIYTMFVICAVFYTIPILVVLLEHAGILPVKYLKGRNKAFAYLAMWLILWVFLPDPTPITATIIMGPFIIVFEIATFIGGRIDKARQKRKNAAAVPYGTSKTGFIAVPGATCKFCNSPIMIGTTFCTECHRSTK